MRKNRKYPIVEVIWRDSVGSMDQELIEDMGDFEPIISKTCGYLVHEDDDKVIIAFMLFDDSNTYAKHWQVIPRGMIKSIKYV